MTEHVDCQGALRQLWDYLDGELTDERMRAVRAHLEKCKGCYPHLEFEKSFLDAVASTKNRACASQMLKERVLAALKAEGFAGTAKMKEQ